VERSTTTHTAPERHASVPASERKLTPDLARGFMLLLIAMAYAGMYLTADDIGGYGEPFGGTAADRAASAAAALFLENRAFPLFGVLFGIGMVMMIDSARAKGRSDEEIRRVIRRRSLWLLVFGLLHAALVFPGEILAAYGLAGLLFGWLLFRSDRAVDTATWIAIAYYTLVVGGGTLAAGLAGESESWKGGIAGYTTLEDWISRSAGAVGAPLISVLFFPMIILVVLGIRLGRKGYLQDPDSRVPALRKAATIGVSVSVAGALPHTLAGLGVVDVPDAASMPLFGLQILTGVAAGVGYAALFALIGRRLQRRSDPITKALAAAGQRSLSVYLFCSVGVALLLHPDLIGLGDHLHRAGGMAVAFGVWTVGVALAAWLAAKGRRGPADALLRKLAYR
jgi:uncharacterized protein